MLKFKEWLSAGQPIHKASAPMESTIQKTESKANQNPSQKGGLNQLRRVYKGFADSK